MFQRIMFIPIYAEILIPLMGYEVAKVFEVEVSGAKTREKRPVYNELCEDAFISRFDAMIGWDVLRFRRSMKEFLSSVSDMDDKGINVIAAKNSLNTVSSSGRIITKLGNEIFPCA
jgi:DNA invertase Pin-like site-specific DNA recombinase